MLVQPRDAEAKRIERELHAVADEELRADLGIAKAEGDVSDDLALARRERLGSRLAELGHEPRLQRGRDPHLTRGDRAERVNQRFDRKALEDDAARAGPDGGERVVAAFTRR